MFRAIETRVHADILDENCRLQKSDQKSEFFILTRLITDAVNQDFFLLILLSFFLRDMHYSLDRYKQENERTEEKLNKIYRCIELKEK
jgi:hypothetical protein